MLQIDRLNKSYGKKQALVDISFTVHPHQILGVFGPNGCGKSTLFRLIMGILAPSSGTITYNGIKSDSVRDHFGYMPEQRAMLVDLTLHDHLVLIGRLKQHSAEYLHFRIRTLADQFHLTFALDQPIRKLSKGNQQKAQLMMALIDDPKVVILDEPFNGLDVAAREELAVELRKLAHQGTSILISSHVLEAVSGLCDSILVLSEGKAQLQGNLSALRSQQSTVRIWVNADSNWKDLPTRCLSVYPRGHHMEFSFETVSDARQALVYFSHDRSVHALHYEVMGLRTLLEA
jgi:ABC-2 type transport system ATP-binding protein